MGTLNTTPLARRSLFLAQRPPISALARLNLRHHRRSVQQRPKVSEQKIVECFDVVIEDYPSILIL
jgi:hypothetical protein